MKTATLKNVIEQLIEKHFPHYRTTQGLIQSQQINQKKTLNTYDQICRNVRYREQLSQLIESLSTANPLHDKTQQEIIKINRALKQQQQQLDQYSQQLTHDNTQLSQLRLKLNSPLFLTKTDYNHHLIDAKQHPSPHPVNPLTQWELKYCFSVHSHPLEFEMNAYLSHFNHSQSEAIDMRCRLQHLKPGKTSHYGLIPLDRIITASQQALFGTEDSEHLLKQIIQQLGHYHQKGITHGDLSLKHFKCINNADSGLLVHLDRFYKKGFSILSAVQDAVYNYAHLFNTLDSALSTRSLHSLYNFSNPLFSNTDFPHLSRLLQFTQHVHTTDCYFEPTQLKKTIKELSKLIHSPPTLAPVYKKDLHQFSSEFNSILTPLTQLTTDPGYQNIISKLSFFRSSPLFEKQQFTDTTNHCKILNHFRFYLKKLLAFLENHPDMRVSPSLLHSVLTLINNPLLNHHDHSSNLLKLKIHLQGILNTFKQQEKQDKITLANIIQSIFTHEKFTPLSSSISQSDSSDEESAFKSAPQHIPPQDQKCFPANAHDIAFILLKENTPATEIIKAIEDKDDMIEELRRSPIPLAPDKMETAFFTLNVSKYRRNSPIVFSIPAENKTPPQQKTSRF